MFHILTLLHLWTGEYSLGPSLLLRANLSCFDLWSSTIFSNCWHISLTLDDWRDTHIPGRRCLTGSSSGTLCKPVAGLTSMPLSCESLRPLSKESLRPPSKESFRPSLSWLELEAELNLCSLVSWATRLPIGKQHPQLEDFVLLPVTLDPWSYSWWPGESTTMDGLLWYGFKMDGSGMSCWSWFNLVDNCRVKSLGLMGVVAMMPGVLGGLWVVKIGTRGGTCREGRLVRPLFRSNQYVAIFSLTFLNCMWSRKSNSNCGCFFNNLQIIHNTR